MPHIFDRREAVYLSAEEVAKRLFNEREQLKRDFFHENNTRISDRLILQATTSMDLLIQHTMSGEDKEGAKENERLRKLLKQIRAFIIERINQNRQVAKMDANRAAEFSSQVIAALNRRLREVVGDL